jgi:hypothetical protein
MRRKRTGVVVLCAILTMYVRLHQLPTHLQPELSGLYADATGKAQQ